MSVVYYLLSMFGFYILTGILLLIMDDCNLKEMDKEDWFCFINIVDILNTLPPLMLLIGFVPKIVTEFGTNSWLIGWSIGTLLSLKIGYAIVRNI